MIDLYTSTTPNGRKVTIMLEELGVPYNVHHLDLGKGEQKTPEFLAINPNGKIPALVDEGGAHGKVTIFESGAILVYLAEREGKLLPKEGPARYEALAWLMFQMGGVGPMFGQAGFFKRATEQVPFAIDRYFGEARRLLEVLEGRLAKASYLAGEYSIADIATYPWVASGTAFLGLETGPHVSAWLARIGERPAVKRGMEIPAPKSA
ncbi:glutathione S-transferase family protein [Sorangium sp. So ce1078]|uniref:glutathione S-transferase family protein n=1 Tax=Sorangium sp. So ce1078 TaxID=3133329 RepID=UPI003F60F4CB